MQIPLKSVDFFSSFYADRFSAHSKWSLPIQMLKICFFFVLRLKSLIIILCFFFFAMIAARNGLLVNSLVPRSLIYAGKMLAISYGLRTKWTSHRNWYMKTLNYWISKTFWDLCPSFATQTHFGCRVIWLSLLWKILWRNEHNFKTLHSVCHRNLIHNKNYRKFFS